jgi:hypothetical protein
MTTFDKLSSYFLSLQKTFSLVVTMYDKLSKELHGLDKLSWTFCIDPSIYLSVEN